MDSSGGRTVADSRLYADFFVSFLLFIFIKRLQIAVICVYLQKIKI